MVEQLSRPDMAYQYVYLSTKQEKATHADLRQVFKMLSKCKIDTQELQFSALDTRDPWSLVTFTDASHARIDGINSVMGEVTFLMDSKGRANILDWKSNKLKIPVGSSLAAETQAALHGQGKLEYFAALIKESLGYTPQCKLVTDSRSLHQAVNSNNSIQDKRTAVAIATLRACVGDQLAIQWIKGSENPADLLTKPGASPIPLRNILNNGTIHFL